MTSSTLAVTGPQAAALHRGPAGWRAALGELGSATDGPGRERHGHEHVRRAVLTPGVIGTGRDGARDDPAVEPVGQRRGDRDVHLERAARARMAWSGPLA